jgi:hypothetical protein
LEEGDVVMEAIINNSGSEEEEQSISIGMPGMGGGGQRPERLPENAGPVM